MRNGGGVYFGVLHGEGLHEFQVWNDSAYRPVEFSNNTAAAGGAFYFTSTSSVTVDTYASFVNTRIDNNIADNAAAFYIESYGEGTAGTSQVYTHVLMTRTLVGDFVPGCAPGVRCNTLSDNQAQNGCVVEVQRYGPTGTASVYLDHAAVRDNFAGSDILCGSSAPVTVESSLFEGNTAQNLISVTSAALRVRNSTIADNPSSSGSLFFVVFQDASLELAHDILYQGEGSVDAANITQGLPFDAHDIGFYGVDVGLDDPGLNIQGLDPEPFVNRTQGDFHLLLTSAAVDRWGPSGDPNDPPPVTDLDGALRPFQFNSPITPYDFGAYEAGALTDAIFVNGFDP
ncbi:MAG TPA: hypothetical protein VFG55_07215 [Rhodanobacteraceae bacterium]|nr:hypothetical protein [Rhodanobacteraceae bacterium]